ncbi:MAG: SusD/RagB family nutrient-binding outer membrane lipoprotein [Bacteroidota bacterium]
MKNIIKPIYSLLIAITLLGAGCTKFDENINVDPNNPSKVSGTQLIANAQFFLPGISSSAYGVHYPQYLSLTLFPDNARYVGTNFSFSSWYTGPLNNLETVINSTLDANEGPISNQLAVAKILKAYFMWHMTDRWGDLPFSEALKGEANYTPKYDKQQDIYNAMFKLLDEANAAITLTSAAGNIKNDIVYKGDMLKWKKLGNTIHLLMALRLSKVDAAKGKAEFEKALANGIMTSNADNLAYPHLSQTAHQNFWYNSFTVLGREWYAVSKPLVDYMKPLDDPRLKVFANPAVTSNDYVGLAYGLATEVKPNDYSLLGSSLRMQNSPVQLVTYAQSLFALAEAAKITWIPGGDATAETHYNNAITQSIAQWTGSSSSAAAYLAKADVAYTPAAAIQKIAYQRWVHLFLHGYEAWAEWRRTGYPTLVAAPGANGDRIPRREGYPTQEASINKASYDAAVAAMPYGGGDNLNARVWWDKP